MVKKLALAYPVRLIYWHFGLSLFCLVGKILCSNAGVMLLSFSPKRVERLFSRSTCNVACVWAVIVPASLCSKMKMSVCQRSMSVLIFDTNDNLLTTLVCNTSQTDNITDFDSLLTIINFFSYRRDVLRFEMCCRTLCCQTYFFSVISWLCRSGSQCASMLLAKLISVAEKWTVSL